LTTKQIYLDYFNTKFLIGLGLGLFITFVRVYNGHNTTVSSAIIFIFFLIALALLLGFLDYFFYEKSLPKMKLKLLNQAPLTNFQDRGFVIQEKDKIVGRINNFKVILAPFSNAESEKFLTILIPVQPREGLEQYFSGLNENFKLTFNDPIIFAKAILNNYVEKYDYDQLFDLIEQATSVLKDKNIEPIAVLEE